MSGFGHFAQWVAAARWWAGARSWLLAADWSAW